MFDRGVSITLTTPDAAELVDAVRTLSEWQLEGAPVQLHPGDIGWFWRFGAQATADAVRVWSRDGRPLAIGLLDGPEVLRMAIAPEAQDDDELAASVQHIDAENIEVRAGAGFRGHLRETGWHEGEPWTPLHRHLAEPVADCGLRIEITTPETADVRAAVHRASFEKSIFDAERWRVMAAGPAYADARCLVGYADDIAVAAATVWSAGDGRPGLLEPVGVHRDHRGRGHGTAISIAAAAVLRDLGSSSATVCTPSSNLAAVATYRAAGFAELPAVSDLSR